jgi:ATP-dependent helicase/nuclease subunit A
MGAAYLESDLWAEVQAASIAHAEYPIARHAAADEAEGDGAEAPPHLVRGTIDLAYRHQGAWTLVDVKTDRLAARGDATLATADLAGLVTDDHPYAQQLATYVAAWTDAVDAPLAKAGFWFADAGRFVAWDYAPAA